MRARVIGVDPGLVHTGVVLLEFDSIKRMVHRSILVVDGPDALGVQQRIEEAKLISGPTGNTHIFIEDYRPRSHFSSDARMVKTVADMERFLSIGRGTTVKVVNNTGVKKVIRKDLLMELKCWNFSVSTNHQDLRSAAYIALYGMVKDPELNGLLSSYCHDLGTVAEWNVFG